MAAPNIAIQSIKANRLNTHQTTPLPFTRKTNKTNPVSPGAILDRYNATIREDDDNSDNAFPNTEPTHLATHNVEKDPKRLKARKSYNSVMLDLSAAAKEQLKRKSREIKSNNNEYSSDSSRGSSSSRTSSGSSTHSSSYSRSNSRSRSLSNHNKINTTKNINVLHRPYIDDGGSDEDGADSSFSNNAAAPNNDQINGRYSTYRVNKYGNEPIHDKLDIDNILSNDNNTQSKNTNNSTNNRVTFAALPSDKKPKRGRVTFAVNTDNDDHKNENQSDSSSLTSQSDDLLDDFFSDKPGNYDEIDPDLLSSTHSLHDTHDINKGRKSKFLKFGANFLQSTLHLTGLTSIATDTNNHHNHGLRAPGAPLPNDLENSIQFSDTASTMDFNEHLWYPVSDRSDSSDDSFMEKDTTKTRRRTTHKKKKRGRKKRITGFKHHNHNRDHRNVKSDEEHNNNNDEYDMDEKDRADEIDRFKRSIMDDDIDEDDDDDDDDDVYDLDDSFADHNPFDIAAGDDSNDTDTSNEDNMSVHSAAYNGGKHKHKGDRMWFRHHMGHLKVLKKIFRGMDKDGDGTISFDEFTKFLSKYGVHKKFKPSEIERFFLKITDTPFDADNPNAIEDKQLNGISPALISHASKNDSKNEDKKKSGNKKTSIFFGNKGKSKTAPKGEVDMATFLYYFSSPIDSQAMGDATQRGILEREATNTERTDRDTIVSADLQFTQSMIIPEKVRRSKYAAPYSRAVAIAADKAKHKIKKSKEKNIDKKIDASLLFSTNKAKKKGGKIKRHSLAPKSTGNRLKKRTNKNDITKRGSISTIRQYHFQQRASKNGPDLLLDMTPISNSKKSSIASNNTESGLNAMSLMINRESNKYKDVEMDASNASHSSLLPNNNNIDDGSYDKRFKSMEEMDSLVKLMRKHIQKQDRKNKSNGDMIYKNCFVGRDAVTWFVNKEFVSSRHGGLLLGRKLARKGYIKYAGTEARDFEDEIIFFYQFCMDKDRDNRSDTNGLLLPYNTIANPNESFPSLTGIDDSNITERPSIINDESKSHTPTVSSNENKEQNNKESDMNNRISTLTNDTPVPDASDVEYTQSASILASIIKEMSASITRSSHRSLTLASKEDIFSGTEIIDWFIKYNHCKNRTDAIIFGGYIRRQGLIRHIEFHPVFKDGDDEWYRICSDLFVNENELDANNNSKSSEHLTESILYAKTTHGTMHGLDMGMGHIMEDEAHIENQNSNTARATMPVNKYYNPTHNNRRHNDSIASNFTTTSEYTNNTNNKPKLENRTSLVLGQMGRGRATRGKKKEKLVQDLFSFIIGSQINTTFGMSSEALFNMDLIVDGIDHPHIMRLLNKIETKFKKCDEHSRGSLGKEEFNRFLIKCGIILHAQDLNVVFKIFDKNNTGLIDYYNFSQNSLVHRVPGIKTENLTVTHLVKHTISVNFGISSGKRGFDDQYTVISMSIANAFEEINTSNTGEITMDEFRLAYRKNGIEIYGGVTHIFERLCSDGKNTISIANFIGAFQGTIFANRAEPPKLQEVLSKLGIIQWTLGDKNNNNNNNNNHNSMDIDNEDSVQTVQSNVTNTTAVAGNDYISKKMLAITPQNHIITPQTITPSGVSSQDRAGLNLIQNTNENGLVDENSNGYIVGAPNAPNGLSSPTISTTTIGTDISITNRYNTNAHNNSLGGLHQVKESRSFNTNMNTHNNEHGRTDTQVTTKSTIIPMNIETTVPLANNKNDKNGMTRVRSLTNEMKSPHVQVTLSLRESFDKVWITFFKSAFIIALPGVIMNSLLHFLQAIPVNTGGDDDGAEDFPLVDLTWYIFGFLVYLALQSTMVGLEVTKSLILFYTIVAGGIGALLAIATIVGFALENKIFGNGNNTFAKGKGIGWWTGLFLVYLICECAARLKYMKIFGSQRTKREYVWYALKSAIGVTLFWFIQTFVSLIVVNVSFSVHATDRWPIILYCAITLTVIRNVSLNSLGTAFIAKLSDHFYLEDVEMMEMRTDQMLLTQLSIISSYSSLWYLFTKTYETDWNWVLCGILTYQFILLAMDITLTKYIRPKMVSLLKGELIAWFAVGARAVMNFIFPFGFNNPIKDNPEFDNKWGQYIQISLSKYWDQNLIWIVTYCVGPTLLLSLLWLRIYKIWSYDNVENYWDFDDFTLNLPNTIDYISNKFCKCCQKNNNIKSPTSQNSNSNSPPSSQNIKQRNRLMIICALTIGFIVSVTEAVSLWSDNPNTPQYEGFIDLDF